MSKTIRAVLLLAALAGATTAPAQTADPTAGRRLAASLCVECHRIDADTPARDAESKAPSFVELARMPSTNELAIKVFLRTSHAKMPNLILTADETDSIAAYIVGLAKK
ncbi:MULTISPECIES: c-type cytochrome [Methylosinus]|uniref:Cytochrome C n=1 Tax=Methylosinus trichosporium (strain ATCC 35070 / NCIMB 11131 / UNIQEM 75 / OB3b) TaxID=595536 RepID=A0A2D2D2M3_METT3|nr:MULTISPECIES: c-type cytochrome [Methylosinus]ATQ69247.1 cytochrome C [Methylosinus trichosporium OB3b]OBS53267.1 cytochrome C [Methylosinus sp. 3S-1]